MFRGTKIYKIGSEICEPLPQKIWQPKHQHFSAISDKFATVECNKMSSVGRWRCKLQSLLEMNALWSTNGKIGPEFWPPKISFLDTHISGAKWRCPLEILQVWKWPRLDLQYPTQFFNVLKFKNFRIKYISGPVIRVSRGICTKIFRVMRPGMVIKIWVPNILDLSP